MRSSGWAPIAGWLAATATSIVLASVALLPVLRSGPGGETALAQLPAAETSSFPVPLPSVTSEDPPEAPPAAEPTRAPARTPTTAPATKERTPPPTTRAAPPPTTAAPRPTEKPRVEDGWTVTTGTDGLRTYVRSFKVAGGQAVIRMTSDGVVKLVTATPADGYDVQKVQDSPGNMAVYFNELPSHSFIIHATWFNDRPFAEVSEIGS